ncbi:MAG: hypothetical protein EOO62_16500 [Hymenobacter sp.]|nr:MAG: hypothetical protein EOO62_16500 [Hymenobacter sp.]
MAALRAAQVKFMAPKAVKYWRSYLARLSNFLVLAPPPGAGQNRELKTYSLGTIANLRRMGSRAARFSGQMKNLLIII